MNSNTTMNLNPYTPNEEDIDVKRLLEYIKVPHVPIRMPINALNGAKLSDCTNIVAEYVKNNGGNIIYGWQIWKSAILVEAEFHAVWENLKGELVDLTPKPPGFSHILFAKDDSIIYQGKQIDSIRLNITDNPLVDHFIEALKAIYRLQNNGEKAFLDGQAFIESLSEEEIQRLTFCTELRQSLFTMVKVGATIDSPCLCGKPIAYKDCHGRDFNKFIFAISPY